MEQRFAIRLVILLLVMIFATACSGNLINPAIDGMTPNIEDLPPAAALKARETLVAELDLGIEEVTILSQEQKTWSDSCLGLGGAAESCLQAEVDGWLVELGVNGNSYKARTDWLGEQIRFEP